MKGLIFRQSLLCTLLIFGCTATEAQMTITNTLMGSGSYSTERPKISLAYSFGEAFIFSTGNDAVYYNQGFHNAELAELVSVNNFKPVSATLYPNPVQDRLFVRSELSFQTIEIHSLSGTLVLKSSLTSDQFVDLNAIPSGLYLVRLYGENQKIYAGKIVRR